VRRGVEAARNELLTAIGARELAITSAHALAAAYLPPLHRDPFDRIFIAQAARGATSPASSWRNHPKAHFRRSCRSRVMPRSG